MAPTRYSLLLELLPSEVAAEVLVIVLDTQDKTEDRAAEVVTKVVSAQVPEPQDKVTTAEQATTVVQVPEAVEAAEQDRLEAQRLRGPVVLLALAWHLVLLVHL
jgi:hypothetical protein